MSTNGAAPPESRATLRIAVVGGGGHVGLPLSLVLAEAGFVVDIIDRDVDKLEQLRRGEFPFLERGGPELLRRVLSTGIGLHADYTPIRESDAIILTVGTPVDEHLNPKVGAVFDVIKEMSPHLRDGQVLILRSTLFPGTSERIVGILSNLGLDVSVSCCPERIAQGNAIHELKEFPQLVSGSDARALSVSRHVFGALAPSLVELELTEAEMCKLFTNAWRYIKFSVANQFYTMAEEKGLDFYRIRDAMVLDYRRNSDFPVAGFAAGPCLFKDTMQLAAFNRQNFQIGHAAMLVNETLPDFLIDQLKRERPLANLKVGLLGMAFKPDNDDFRESLAYKLRRLLIEERAVVLCTDPYILDPTFVPVEQLLEQAEVIFVSCPHSQYRDLDFGRRRVIDCWGMTRNLRVSQ